MAARSIQTRQNGMRAYAEARDRLIDSLSGYDTDELPRDASTCYVWPAQHCPVGCAHCNFAAPLRAFPGRYSVAEDLAGVLALVREMGSWKVALTGGGEPMEEHAFCCGFLEQVRTDNLEEIEVVTSGHYAQDERAAVEMTGELIDAWLRRGEGDRPKLSLRLSLDWFHVQRLGVQHAVNLIDAFAREDWAGVNLYIRSILLDGDDSLQEVAARLGARIQAREPYLSSLELPDGREILVYYKNLIFDGRMKESRLPRLPVDLPRGGRVSEFEKRFLDPQGKHVPARTYNGPDPLQLPGLAMTIQDDGKLEILEGNAPDRVPRINTVGSWSEALEYFYRDPLTIFLVEHGPEALGELLAPRFPEARGVKEDTNQLYYLVRRMVPTPLHLLYATVTVTRLHVQQGRVEARPSVLEDCARMVS